METLLDAARDMVTPETGWSAELLLRTVLTTVVMFLAIVLLARLFGTRTFASFTTYDFLTNVAAGSLVASAILSDRMVEATVGLVVLVVLQYAVSGAAARSRAARDAADNDPVVLVQDGQVLERPMRRARVSHAILDQHLRASGLTRVDEVGLAVLESGGSISVLRRGAGRDRR
ncbi:hypothetical protein SGUI_0707 [Serinicoccus hydrothermalis]|uniref:YetF C-terminal domain-containing protein n=1 Tax=Serinicoccus hydrothermalis TaxID=1758689 RepID=A0A1B1N9I9_9MICO|nr:YetF domain-containing protein [Serinicoccus hydrothermalis]ANS78103.1 hypothetical protein SGUI_0707 [Serinicoccus hydrothermalis]